MRKRFLFIILTLLPMLAMADDSGMCGSSVTYTYTEANQTLTIQGSGAIDGYPWDTSPWYSYRTNIKTIIIEEGITYIGYGAFLDCSGLTSVTIPNSLTGIGGEAFFCQVTPNFYLSIYIANLRSWCNISEGNIGRPYCLYLNNNLLTELNIPEGVTSIREGAFCNCSEIEAITIPEGVTNIGSYAFFVNPQGGRLLTSVTIPSSLVSIDREAFPTHIGYWTINISDLATWCNILDNNSGLHSEYSRLFLNGEEIINLEIPDGVTNINPTAFSNFKRIATLVIPNSVTSIGDDAFKGCSGLTSVTFPNSVISIGERAFDGCSGLASITIPNSVTSIGHSAFWGCTGLTSVTIPNSVTSIGNNAFYGCSGLTSIIVDNGNIKYDSRNNCNAIIETSLNTLIRGCKNTVIPNNVTSIGNSAFSGSGLTSISIPNSVTSIGNDAFSYCSSLTSVTIPNSVTRIGRSAFYNTAWYNNQPNGLVYAGKVAYKYKGTMPSNTSIIITEGTMGITDNAFEYCSGLTSVTIPNSVKSIGEYAFYSCSALTSINSQIETPFTFGSYAFSFISSGCVLTVPYGTRNAYIAAGWTGNVFKGGIVEEVPIARMSIAEATVRCGYQATIPVQFESELEFGGLQCEVTLPAGITLNKVTKTERLSDVFTLTKSLTGENTYQILLYNIERASFAGTDGALFNLVVDVAGNMEVGAYEIQVKNIVASDVNGNETALADVSAVLHVEEYLTGDANRDGKVNVTDIMAVANYILKINVPNFNEAAADVNGDGKINVTDIMGIANIILQPNNVNNTPLLQMDIQGDDETYPE